MLVNITGGKGVTNPAMLNMLQNYQFSWIGTRHIPCDLLHLWKRYQALWQAAKQSFSKVGSLRTERSEWRRFDFPRQILGGGISELQGKEGQRDSSAA